MSTKRDNYLSFFIMHWLYRFHIMIQTIFFFLFLPHIPSFFETSLIPCLTGKQTGFFCSVHIHSRFFFFSLSPYHPMLMVRSMGYTSGWLEPNISVIIVFKSIWECFMYHREGWISAMTSSRTITTLKFTNGAIGITRLSIEQLPC